VSPTRSGCRGSEWQRGYGRGQRDLRKKISGLPKKRTFPPSRSSFSYPMMYVGCVVVTACAQKLLPIRKGVKLWAKGQRCSYKIAVIARIAFEPTSTVVQAPRAEPCAMNDWIGCRAIVRESLGFAPGFALRDVLQTRRQHVCSRVAYLKHRGCRARMSASKQTFSHGAITATDRPKLNRALIFDCDGVIVESEELHRLSYNEC
jgi:hypothetical protein